MNLLFFYLIPLFFIAPFFGDVKTEEVSFSTEPLNFEIEEPYIDKERQVLEPFQDLWNETDVNNAWNMTRLSKVYTTYTDRLFFDFDSDGKDELILSEGYSLRSFYIFAKNDSGEIKLIGNIEDFLFISHGDFVKPPLKFEMGKASDLSDRKIRVLTDNKTGRHYFTGDALYSSNAHCWICEIVYEDGKITIEPVYIWGWFRDGSNATEENDYNTHTFHYYKMPDYDYWVNHQAMFYDYTHEPYLEEVPMSEIEAFLDDLYKT